MTDILLHQEELMEKIQKLPLALKARLSEKTIAPTCKLIDTALAHLQSHWEAFKSNHNTLRLEKGYKATAYYTEDHYTNTELSCLESVALLEALRTTPAPAAPPEPIVAPVQPPRAAVPPLPKITLPEFSGSYLEWEAFHDAFQCLVLDRDDVPDVQKLLLLKAALKGEAALLVRTIASTAVNFQGAWDAVCTRYRNDRLLVSAHLSALFDLPQVPKESARDLRALIDRAREELRSLEHLGLPVDKWDAVVVFMLLRRLDSTSRRAWELHLSSIDATQTLVNPAYKMEQPTLKQLEAFFEMRIRALEMSAPPSPPVRSTTAFNAKAAPFRSHQASIKNTACVFCGDSHSNFSCSSFRGKSPQDRLSEVKRLRLCYNCLGSHQRNACRSTKTCSKCSQTHNTLLHDSFPTSSVTTTTSPSESAAALHASTVASHSAQQGTSRAIALLTTALVTICSPDGQRAQTRALLDTGSEVSFISEDIVQCLGLARRRSQVKVVGVGASHSATASSQVEVAFQARTAPGAWHQVSAYVLPRLTAHVPQRRVRPIDPQLLLPLELADPSYHQDMKVGLLLGADVFGSLLRPGVYPVPGSKVVAMNTALGWVLSGTVGEDGSSPASSLHCSVEDDLDHTLRRFWELEEIPGAPSALSSEESACEEFFASTYQRDASGRFVVRLPRRSTVPTGGNREQAVRSLVSVERRLARDPSVHHSYCKFMHEYESLGHMHRAEETPTGPVWYLPHHAVTQSGPQGSKIRVVFDASRLNAQGVSLNQHLHPGPPLLNDLGAVIMNWRNHRFVFCADIVKMFRQILVHPDDQDLQRVVWRSHTNEPVHDFKLTTVTYGTTPAPYLAIRVLQELARLEQKNFPKGSECLLHDSYVDDVLSGADSLEDAVGRRDELVQLLASGKFELSKWSSNCSELLGLAEECPKAPAANVELSESTKMLGLMWNPEKDEFFFKERTSSPLSAPATKRTVLSRVSQLFDPLGWISPVVISAKILLQDLWLAKSDWDQPLTTHFEERWSTFLEGLSRLQDIRIPRWTQLSPDDTDVELHGFADASTRAYAAVVYIRTVQSDGTFHTSLLASKTKTAPVKTVSIPRLELCAAQLLVRLLLHVRQTKRISNLPMFGWSDSTVTLAWIRGHPSRWKTFVANRVSYIQTTLPGLAWRHVSGEENPADVASRGATPQTLSTTSLWWNGPPWLSEAPQKWPATPGELPYSPGEEAAQKARSMPAQVEAEFALLTRYSSLSRTLRITAQCMRFARRCDKRGRVSRLAGLEDREQETNTGFLTVSELSAARVRLIRSVQGEQFATEIAQLKGARPISRTSPLVSLNPFLNAHGMLCVGGRLENSKLPTSEKHPPILPKSSLLSQLHVLHWHALALHAGLALTHSLLQKHVWILRGRALTKKLLRACIPCRRRHPLMGQQLMGDLPAARVTPSRPFLRTGVDYAGPIKCRPSPGRGRQSIKAYIALFVCLATKALHLEVVSDLTTKAFLAAFRRFVARRGVCSELLSDNGTTFVGASAELRSMFHQASLFYKEAATTLADSGTHWSFIPPSSPHFGGLWEAGVKSVKGLLRTTIGETTLTYEELSTLLAQVEACLNSRPLTPSSSDTADLSALTPAHFLVGSPLLTIPEPSLHDEPSNLVTRWQLVQRLTHHFWKKWSTQYLHLLQQRPRWRGEKVNFRVGQLVLVHHPQLPPGRWALGRVTELHPGADGLVRVVSVKTATSEFRRPIFRLSPLPIETDVAPSATQSTAAPPSSEPSCSTVGSPQPA